MMVRSFVVVVLSAVAFYLGMRAERRRRRGMSRGAR